MSRKIDQPPLPQRLAVMKVRALLTLCPALPTMPPVLDMNSRVLLLPLLLLARAAAGADPDEIKLVSGIAAIANDRLVTIREATVLAANSAPGLARAYENSPGQYGRLWNKVKVDYHVDEIIDELKAAQA